MFMIPAALIAIIIDNFCTAMAKLKVFATVLLQGQITKVVLRPIVMVKGKKGGIRHTVEFEGLFWPQTCDSTLQ